VRPLSRPPWRAQWAGEDASEVARFGLGFYCSLCEIALPQDAIPWHAASATVVDRGARAADWPDLLVLCRRCTAAASASAATIPPSQLLLPHRDLSFTLEPTSPMRYVRDEATGHVTVVPGSDAAAASVRYFALNGLFAPAADELAPEEDAVRLTMDYLDPRPGLRDQVWKQAAHFAGRLRDATGQDRQERLGLVHLVARSSGFWSIWATVLWQTLGEPDVLSTILQPPTAPAAAALGARPEGELNHAFASTREDWLPPGGDG
jgi:hypothetical protein